MFMVLVVLWVQQVLVFLCFELCRKMSENIIPSVLFSCRHKQVAEKQRDFIVCAELLQLETALSTQTSV